MLGITEEDYRFKLVSCTADGASVNFGVYRGVLTQMREDQQPWMLSIHCVNHRLELAVKDAMKSEPFFAAIDKFLSNNLLSA